MFKILFALMLVHCNASSVYYFGSQSLMCLNGPLFSSTSSAPSRFSYSPWHRLIKYKNYIIEWGTGEYSINYQHPHSRRCRVTWESKPAGRSSKSINEVDNFGRMYEFYNGEYSMIFNNCHMFANGLSRFLTYNTRPNSCAVYIYPRHQRVQQKKSTHSHQRILISKVGLIAIIIDESKLYSRIIIVRIWAHQFFQLSLQLVQDKQLVQACLQHFQSWT